MAVVVDEKAKELAIERDTMVISQVDLASFQVGRDTSGRM